MRERIHDERGVARRPRRLCPVRRERQRLRRSAGEVERERPKHVRGRRHARRQDDRLAIHRHRGIEIALRLLAAREPGQRVRLQVGPMETFGQLHRLGRPLLHGPDVEQQEQGSRQRQHQLAASLALRGIEVTKRRVELTRFHRPLSQRVERPRAPGVKLDAQSLGLGSRRHQLERVEGHAEEPDGLLVRQGMGGLIAGACRVLDGLVDESGRRRLGEVIGELRQPRLP